MNQCLKDNSFLGSALGNLLVDYFKGSIVRLPLSISYKHQSDFLVRFRANSLRHGSPASLLGCLMKNKTSPLEEAILRKPCTERRLEHFLLVENCSPVYPTLSVGKRG